MYSHDTVKPNQNRNICIEGINRDRRRGKDCSHYHTVKPKVEVDYMRAWLFSQQGTRATAARSIFRAGMAVLKCLVSRCSARRAARAGVEQVQVGRIILCEPPIYWLSSHHLRVRHGSRRNSVWRHRWVDSVKAWVNV